MRHLIRSAVELALTASGVPAVARRRRQGTLVLAYHNIVPDEARPFGDRSLHLPVGLFRQQMEQLHATHEVTSLDGLFHPGRAGRPRAAVTFDDAYAGALSLGLPILERLGLPCTIFVAPGLLGLDAPWWDRLADPGRGLAPGDRQHALVTLAGRHEAVLDWAASKRRLSPPDAHGRIATEMELLAALQRPGVSVGLHTWGHPNLAALSVDEAEDELRRCTAWLDAKGARPMPWLAYPYGLTGPAALQASRNAGVRYAFRVEGGWTPPDPPEALELPRLNVPSGLSARGFLLRTSGVFGN